MRHFGRSGNVGSHRIEHWDDERDAGNGIIVTLLPGFSFEPGEHAGVRGFDTVGQAMAAVRGSYPCSRGCPDCKAARGQGGHWNDG